MSNLLADFCSAVRSDPGTALVALLKIAETKDAILRWNREVGESSSPHEIERDRKCIAIAHALAQVDRAEETILDAFCLDRSENLAMVKFQVNN